MTTLVRSLGESKKAQWIFAGIGICLVWAAIAIPRLSKTQTAAAPAVATMHETENFSVLPETSRAALAVSLMTADKKEATAGLYSTGAEAVVPRKIVRTSSLDMIVAHPADILEKIVAVAENMGGYVETSNSGGSGAAAATLTVRVPADRFEQVRAEIRQLGVRVESEKVDAQDVTRQYVDQDASLRNLRAEEAQYLTILKQATTVRDMLAVSEKLSDVRGEIERQEAEFHALSRQIETVSIAISLRTEAQAQTFGLNWKPLYQIKLALHEGLESVANYATVMVGILFFLPAALLWVGTVAIAAFVCWRLLRWTGKRWLGWNTDQPVVKA
jgi:Domain of unknown function (DUF4349)